MRTRVGLIAVPLLALGLAACGGAPAAEKSTSAPNDQGNAAVTAPQPANSAVKVRQSSLGPILTDQDSRTLYAFTKDKGGTSSCSADCIATWPALTSTSPVTAGAGVTPALLQSTKRTEGTAQARYGEWPLYYYAGDVAPGDVNGQGVDGVWFVIKADGKLVRATN